MNDGKIMTATDEPSIYDLIVTDIDGQAVKLDLYRGKVLLIVNTASKCGFTPQYQELQELYTNYASRGLMVLAFPCNQFGGQEPADEEQIQEFCSANFRVTFPLFSKIDVNGRQADPLFQLLKKSAPGMFGTKTIKWNFTKFLVDRQGNVVSRFSPATKPSQLIPEIEKLL